MVIKNSTSSLLLKLFTLVTPYRDLKYAVSSPTNCPILINNRIFNKKLQSKLFKNEVFLSKFTISKFTVKFTVAT